MAVSAYIIVLSVVALLSIRVLARRASARTEPAPQAEPAEQVG